MIDSLEEEEKKCQAFRKFSSKYIFLFIFVREKGGKTIKRQGCKFLTSWPKTGHAGEFVLCLI
jgi:hypothetical protein